MKDKPKKYFFILGNNPTLSIAELASVFNFDEQPRLLTPGNVFLFENSRNIDAVSTIKKLGGTIKLGEIFAQSEKNNTTDIIKKTVEQLEPGEGKFKFGFSYYGIDKFNAKPLAMEIKKYLKEKGVSCRWVTSREKTLSSVVVEQNKLTSKGAEVVLINDNGKLLIGKTGAVQPFKDLSFRDFGRPARDDRSGMLPPKLAQIMINLAHPPNENAAILDPFCGSGTILTEAMLMGYKNLTGTDISGKAVVDTRKNIEWTKKKFNAPNLNYSLHKNDAAKLSQIIKQGSIDAVITEPYLGPQRGRIDIRAVTAELEGLYSKTLSELKKVLRPEGRAVMLFPVFRIKSKSYYLNPDLHNLKINNPIPEILRANKAVKLTERKTIVYGRPDQRVWREIVVLTKN